MNAYEAVVVTGRQSRLTVPGRFWMLEAAVSVVILFFF